MPRMLPLRATPDTPTRGGMILQEVYRRTLPAEKATEACSERDSLWDVDRRLWAGPLRAGPLRAGPQTVRLGASVAMTIPWGPEIRVAGVRVAACR